MNGGIRLCQNIILKLPSTRLAKQSRDSFHSSPRWWRWKKEEKKAIKAEVDDDYGRALALSNLSKRRKEKGKFKKVLSTIHSWEDISRDSMRGKLEKMVIKDSKDVDFWFLSEELGLAYPFKLGWMNESERSCSLKRSVESRPTHRRT